MIWKSKNGPIEVKDMEEEHVAHVLNFLMRKYGGHLTLELILKGRKVHMQEVNSAKKSMEVTFHSPVEAALHAMTHLNGDMASMQIDGYLNAYMDPHNNDPYLQDEWDDEL
jgi:hypothetical protein